MRLSVCLQVQGNPLKTSQRRLFATLAFTLPSLRHLNERVLPPPESSADTVGMPNPKALRHTHSLYKDIDTDKHF